MTSRSAWKIALLLGALACNEGEQRREALTYPVDGGTRTASAVGGDTGVSAPAPQGPTNIAATAGAMKEKSEGMQVLHVNPIAQAGSGSPGAPAMIVRSGHASIEVDSLESAVARIRQLAPHLGGYVANTAVQAGREQPRSATLQLKVPADRFDQAVSGLESIGKLESVNVTAEDVGEEFVDIRARVDNARRLEERLISLLANRTGKLQHVLTVERELGRVREEIERYEGRLRFLRSRAAVSSLSITVHEPLPVVGAYRGASVLGEAFEQAWRNFVEFLAAVIASLGIVLPAGALLVGAWLGLRHLRRRPPPSAAGAA